jgi:8-oxo-dGTP pyrophosphatase MutT (NUDIX family)
VDQYTRRFDALVDAVFFTRLFADADRDADAAERDFVDELVKLARGVLEDAMQSLPIPAAREYRALSYAEARFWSASRRNFPQLRRVELEINESNGHTA